MTSATTAGALAAFIDLKDSEDQDVDKDRQRKFLLQIQRHVSSQSNINAKNLQRNFILIKNI